MGGFSRRGRRTLDVGMQDTTGGCRGDGVELRNWDVKRLGTWYILEG